jgi:hypothetical protein
MIDAGESKHTKKIEITNISDKDCELRLIEYPDDLVRIELPEKIPAGGTAVAVVKLTPKATEAKFANSFTFEINDEDKTRYSVGVTGRPGTPTLKMNY